ncbi:hypothetical protein ACVIGA_000917 [Bradyrhizobium sp. USDA 3240]
MAKKLDDEEAMRRVQRIVPMLARDTWHALRVRSAFSSANDEIWELDISETMQFGDTYNVVTNALQLQAALAVARVFDVSNPERYPIEQQDKASIPVLAHLLRRSDVQQALLASASDWRSGMGAEADRADCRAAISLALEVYEHFEKDEDHRRAFERLRKIRDARLAHHLFDKVPAADELPEFDQLFLLANTAAQFVRAAMLAVEGRDQDLRDQEAIKSKMDRRFWHICLSALQSAEDDSPQQLGSPVG